MENIPPCVMYGAMQQLQDVIGIRIIVVYDQNPKGSVSTHVECLGDEEIYKPVR